MPKWPCTWSPARSTPAGTSSTSTWSRSNDPVAPPASSSPGNSTIRIHARHIVTDHGWKITLDRGLDIFQRYEMNDSFDFANRLQQQRACKAFEVTYLRV